MSMHELTTMLRTDWPPLLGVAVISTILLTGVLIAAQLAGWTRMDVPLMRGPWWSPIQIGPGWWGSRCTW